jgi:hypothetical protein
MKKSQVVFGGVYRVRWHDGSFANVQIIGTRGYPVRGRGYPYAVTGSKSRYVARNLSTGRSVVIKSAAKLRERVA